MDVQIDDGRHDGSFFAKIKGIHQEDVKVMKKSSGWREAWWPGFAGLARLRKIKNERAPASIRVSRS
jgi:hypothetical protein